MNKFVRNLLTEWRKLKLPFETETVVLGVSGGADSVSLALAISELKKRNKLKNEIIIAHFNHNLRGEESEADVEFVKELAQKIEFEFISETQRSKQKIQEQRGNLEENARIARYDFLSRVAKSKNAHSVLVAHTKNDQAETLLFNLFRGSGLEGLGGMKAVQRRTIGEEDQFEFLLIRPLLNWASREDTEFFCKESQIFFCQDRMNNDLNFSRVWIRKEIIPLIKKINPQIINSLSQTANIICEEVENLNIPHEKIPEILSLKKIINEPKSVRRRILRGWLLKHRGNLRQLDLKHFEALERLIFSRKSGRIVELPNNEKVIKKDSKLLFEKSRVEKSCSDN